MKAWLKTVPAVIDVQSDKVNLFTDAPKLIQQLKYSLKGLVGEVMKI